MKKIKSLSKIIFGLGLKKEAEDISSLDDSSVQPWLSEWRDVMRHYGFQNFGRDKKWHKGKSHLEEPLDRTSAEHDIHMVEQAHTPDSEGRRISDKSLDKFMKEFYGENIWIAPREGWRSKMNKSASKNHSNPNARFTHYSKQTTLPLNWLLEIFEEDRLKEIYEFETDDIIGDLEVVKETGRTPLDMFVDDNWDWISDMVIDHGVSTRSSLEYVGAGSYGVVWRLPDGELMKITTPNAVGRNEESIIDEKIKLMHSGDPFSRGDVRILANYTITIRSKDFPEDPSVQMIAIIMNEVKPASNLNSTLGISLMKELNRLHFLLQGAIESFVQKYLKDPSFILDSNTIISEDAMMAGIAWSETERQNFEDQLFNSLEKIFRPGTPGKTVADIITSESSDLRPDWFPRFLRTVAQHISRDQCDIHAGNMGVDIKGDMVFYDA